MSILDTEMFGDARFTLTQTREISNEADGEDIMKGAGNSVRRTACVTAFIVLFILFSLGFCFAADQPAVIRGALIDATTRRPVNHTLALSLPPEKGQDPNKYHDAMNGIKFSIDKSGKFTFTNVMLPGTYSLISSTYGLLDIVRVTKGATIDLGTISIGVKRSRR